MPWRAATLSHSLAETRSDAEFRPPQKSRPGTARGPYFAADPTWPGFSGIERVRSLPELTQVTDEVGGQFNCLGQVLLQGAGRALGRFEGMVAILEPGNPYAR
jgi:hypothetical protein